MLRTVTTWFKCWWRRNHNYRGPRRIAAYRATTTAEKLFNSGALQSGRLTGNPLAR